MHINNVNGNNNDNNDKYIALRCSPSATPATRTSCAWRAGLRSYPCL